MLGTDKIRMDFNIINELLLILTHLEKIILFLKKLYIAELSRLFLFASYKPFFSDGIPSFVFILIDISGVVDFLQNELNDFFMTVLGRADKVIVADAELLPEISKARGHLIAMRLRI